MSRILPKAKSQFALGVSDLRAPDRRAWRCANNRPAQVGDDPAGGSPDKAIVLACCGIALVFASRPGIMPFPLTIISLDDRSGCTAAGGPAYTSIPRRMGSWSMPNDNGNKLPEETWQQVDDF